MVCDVCKGLCSDHVMTYCRKKWMCPDCFQKWQKSPDARYDPSETSFRLLKEPDNPIPPWKITSYAFLGTEP